MQRKKEYRFSAYFVVIGIFFLSGVIFGFTGQTFGTLLSSMSFCGVGTVCYTEATNGEKSTNEVFSTNNDWNPNPQYF